MAAVTMRPGTPSDAAWLIGLFDEAVAWMVARGQSGQWGTEPTSARPDGVRHVSALAGGGGLRVAELDGEPVGALVLGSAPDYVPPATEPELYVVLVLTSRRHSGRQIGSRLIQAAVEEARARGALTLRVDCWAGAPSLVAWYERQGFAPCGTFDVRGWPGQILSMPVAGGGPGSLSAT